MADMTHLEWQQLEATVAGMTDDERQRLATLIVAIEPVKTPTSKDSIIGLFADEPDLIEQIIQDTYRLRETQPFRTGE